MADFKPMILIAQEEYDRLKKIEQSVKENKDQNMQLEGQGEPETSFASSRLRFQQVVLDDNKTKKKKPTPKTSILDLKAPTGASNFSPQAQGSSSQVETDSDQPWYYIGEL